MADQHWLIAGLGNPGRSYARTWHNAGFQAIDRIAKIYALSFKRERFQSRNAEIRLKNSHCLFIKPQTYMNRSGEAVQSAIQYHEIAIERFLVIYDDIDLPFGSIRIRNSGGPGTHNGMRSIIDRLQNQSFPRIRIGIGPKNPDMDLADYVLSKVPRSLAADWEKVIDLAARAAVCTLEEGLESAMRQYNQRVVDESDDAYRGLS